MSEELWSGWTVCDGSLGRLNARIWSPHAALRIAAPGVSLRSIIGLSSMSKIGVDMMSSSASTAGDMAVRANLNRAPRLIQCLSDLFHDACLRSQ